MMGIIEFCFVLAVVMLAFMIPRGDRSRWKL